MSAYTKGDWVVRIGAPTFRPGSVNVLSVNGDYICEVGDVAGENAEADAVLIAAAPALLAALTAVMRMDVKGHALQDRLQFTPEGRAILEPARAAIAKALGETA